jgi:hypothetical protein
MGLAVYPVWGEIAEPVAPGAQRAMTKGQRAIAVAMIYPEAPGRGIKGSDKISEPPRMVWQARTVLAYSRPLAEAVLAGQFFVQSEQT